MRKKLAGCLASVAAMTALTVAGAPGAQAAPAAGHLAAQSSTFTIPAGKHSVTATAGGASVTAVRSALVSPNTAVTCTLTVSAPFRYYGGTYGGGEEGLASVSCTGQVSQLQVTVGLYYYGNLATYSTRTWNNVFQGGADTEYPVQSGQWQTGALSNITWADGSAGGIPENYSAIVTL